MLFLGLDMGTTTISGVVTDENGRVLQSVTEPHAGFLPAEDGFSRIQDATALTDRAMEIARGLMEKHEISAIGITGQQHGIVYLDENGKALSPLYTWQDGRGNLPYEGSTYAAWLTERSGYAMATGYGLVTHYYNTVHGLVPENAAVLTTVHDFLAMRLAGCTRPVTEPSDAQSLGFFDLKTDDFDREAISRFGMDPAILPEVRREAIVGKTEQGVPVAVAIGDNPASFLGTTKGERDCVLLNVGTGSQISVWTQEAVDASPLETRPYPLGGYLLVGAALCGGRAWAMTERFFSDVLFAFTGERKKVYGELSRLLDETPDDGTHLAVETCFEGTRANPERRGSITGIDAARFNPGKFAMGVLYGMTEELYQLYEGYLNLGLEPKSQLIGSGNGLRLNAHLCRISQKVFGCPMTLPDCPEEAAVGAALYSSMVCKKESA